MQLDIGVQIQELADCLVLCADHIGSGCEKGWLSEKQAVAHPLPATGEEVVDSCLLRSVSAHLAALQSPSSAEPAGWDISSSGPGRSWRHGPVPPIAGT
jgi:hypothetical protein